jgi:hypothetical protein
VTVFWKGHWHEFLDANNTSTWLFICSGLAEYDARSRWYDVEEAT